MASNFRAFLALAAVFTVSGAVASTPDGQTPSEETICDAYSGAAFGLCNAYCEAMDCDADPNADQQACDTVGGKFTARTGEAPPCEYTPPVCEDVEGGATASPSERCPAKEGALQCTFAEAGPTIFYCDEKIFELYGTKGCFPSDCKEETAPTCQDYGLKDVDGTIECRSEYDPTIIECSRGTGTVWSCDTAKSDSDPGVCYDTGCKIIYDVQK